MTEVQPGAAVTLKGGTHGPVMTVAGLQGQSAVCLWFVGLELRRADIPVAALRVVKR